MPTSSPTSGPITRAPRHVCRSFSTGPRDASATYPKLGRPGKILGTRELIPHESYRLVYEISEGTVWILALVHTARQWPLIVGVEKSWSIRRPKGRSLPTSAGRPTPQHGLLDVLHAHRDVPPIQNTGDGLPNCGANEAGERGFTVAEDRDAATGLPSLFVKRLA